MKYLSAFVLLIGTTVAAQAQTITSTGFSWTPAELTVTAGTPITITVTGNHDMREVSEDTWNANGVTSNGGFEYLAGTHILTLDVPGTYWYVCVTHISSGMKGKIIVESGTGIEEEGQRLFEIMPDPASVELLINTVAGAGSQVALIDMDGREVLRHTLLGANRIPVAHLAEGNYIAVLLNATGAMVARKRIIIAR